MSRVRWRPLLCILVLHAYITPGQSLTPERCEAQSRLTVVNPDAEAFIGVVLPVRATGQGLLGCGKPTQDGVEQLEALRWATGVLNSGTESLIPGVKLGLKIWDTCGRAAAVAPALSDLLPVLREGPALCTNSLSQANESALLVGVIDGAGATKDPDTRLTLSQYSVPVLVLEPETLVPAEDRAKAVVALALELQWRQVALVYGADDYGTRMYRAAIRLAADNDLCVVAAERLGSEEDQRSAESVLNAIHSAANMASATIRGSNVTGVLVMSRRSHYLPLLTTIRHSDTSGLQWLFSDLLTNADLITSDNFYSLTLSPASIPPFEQYWANQVQQLARNVDNNIVLEYEMSRRGCKLPGWAGPNINELPNCSEAPKRDSPDSLRAALRGRNAASALHVVHTLAYALKSAWKENCGEQDIGICPALRSLTRQEFGSKYLSPLEFDHAAPGSIVSGVPRGGKLRSGDPSEMAASSLALLAYRGDSSSDNQKLHKLFEYHLDGVEVSDRSFRNSLNRVDVTCSEDDHAGQCPRCIRLREARVRGITSARSILPMTRLPSHHTIASPQQIYVAAMFSVHSAPIIGAPLLGECGPLEPSSARQVEAFTWALRRVNERMLAPLNIKLGAILLDACHSTARALTLPASLMGEGSEPILAAVNVLSDEEAKSATSVFTALNITSVSTNSQRVSDETYSMQIGPAASAMGAALQGVLQHLGWDYVSVVTSHGDHAAQQGIKSLRTGSLCIAHEEILAPEESVDQALARVLAARATGARGVIVWTREEDTRRVFTAASRARTAGTLSGENIFWLVVSPQGEATQILEEFGDVVSGAIIFSPEQKSVKDFLQYLRRLRQDEIHTIADNPWLESYYEQVLQPCSGVECEKEQQMLLEEGNPQDARTIQAVFALGAAVARVRQELCPNLPAGIPGLCPPGGGRPDMRQALNAYLHYTPSERAGGGDDFTFTSRGDGDIAIDILNLRRGGARVKSRGLNSGINFEKVGVYRGEMQNIASLLGYRDSGEEVQLSSLTSRCSKHCSKCRSTDRFHITHPDTSESPTLYLGVSLSMHDTAKNHPLECGSQVNARGVQQLEALLWALDRANLNGSMRLSAVVMDSCGSSARTSRDVALLLDEQNEEMISENLIGMISADGPSIASTITNLAVPMGIPVITSDSSLHKTYAPYPLQLNAGLRMRTKTLLTLTRRLDWSAVSVVYVDDGGDSAAMLRVAQAEARRHGVNIVHAIAIPAARDERAVHAVQDTVLTLRDKARESGVRGVLLLLPRAQLEVLLQATKNLHVEGDLVPGELIWMGVGDEDLFNSYSEETLGSLVLQPKVGWVPEFEQHFRGLNLSYASTRDPWFSEFWSNVFHCNGAACGSGLYKDLSTYNVDKDPEVVNIINAVMSVSHALDSVRRELCPEPGATDCAAMKDLTRVRRRLLDVSPHMAFVGAGMCGVAFSTAGGENMGAALQVLNVRRVGSHVFGLVPVGSVSSKGVVDLQQSTMKAYHPDLSEMPLKDVTSECGDCELADKQKTFMEVSPGHAVTVLGVGSIHSSSSDSLSQCGPLRSADDFQRTAALAYAIEKANTMTNFTGLSALLFDDCSQPSRAIYQTFGYLANNEDNSTNIISTPDTVAITLFVDKTPNMGLSSMLTSQGIPYIFTQDEGAVIRARLHAALGVAQELGWSRITIVKKVDSRWSKLASEMLIHEILPLMKTMCLGNELILDIKNNDDITKELQTEINNPLLLLFETIEENKIILNVLSELRHRSKVIISNGWDASMTYNNTIDAEIFTIGQDYSTEVVPGFREFVASAVKSKTGNIPSQWSSEFLLSASGGKWKQAEGVSDIVQIVDWIAQEVKRLCNQDDESSLCGQDTKSFRSEMQATLTAKMTSKAPNLAIYHLNGTKNYDRVGTWRKSEGLNANVKKWRRSDGVECENYRVGRSGKLTSVLEGMPAPPSLLGELRLLWGVVSASISVLGALLTVALVVYFASATQKTTGTSILGFQILFGVLILYGSNFAFLMAPSEISCLIRRLLPGLAYAVILSGMLVKVVTTWRCQGCTKGSLPDGDPLSRPCGLLCCSLALVVVQAFLAGGWILLIPAEVEPPTSLNGTWTCSAATGRELLGSLSFLGALLLTTFVVALKARKDSEARNILACCILLALAGGAWVAAANSTTLAAHHRDCVAGVVAGLLTATLVLLCLFIPKLIQYAKLSREQKRQHHQSTMLSAHSKLQPVMYGVPHYPGGSPHSLVIKAFPEPDELMGVERMMSAVSDATLDDDGSEPELAAIRDQEEEASNSSVTRSALDLAIEASYPLDMYSGPPQTTSTFGHGAPPPPPMPRFSLVDHCIRGSNEFTAPPPPDEGVLGGDVDLSKHEGISYI